MDTPPRNLFKHECNVFYRDDILRGFGNTPMNGFFFHIIVRDRTGLYYFSPDINEWVFHYNVNEDHHVCTRIVIKFEHITENRGRAIRFITGMLQDVNIPPTEHPYMIGKIYSKAVWLARQFENIADKRIPILVDIVKVYAQTVSNLYVLDMEEDEDVDEDENEIEEEEDEEEDTAEVVSSPMDEYKPIPATRSSIVTLEKVKLGEKGVCAICLEEIAVNSEATRLPCKHMFHGGCVVEWLGRMHVCPLCRFQMPAAALGDDD